MSAELVIMAAGMGSRFGGLKQASPIGANGEMIIDYSVYDAKNAGFDKAVIVIRKDIESDFRAMAGRRIEKMIDTEYVFQELSDLPEGFSCPEGREKPWGTAHAVLAARNAVKNPFLVINADDYYGRTVYKKMFDSLTKKGGMSMAGYRLSNTLSENGSVSRGICTVRDGYLLKVEEMTDITPDTDLSPDTVVSMNMWGLDTGIFGYIERKFETFLKEHINEPKSEFFLPSVISERMREENLKVRVEMTDEVWYGVTYKEDAPKVHAALTAFTEKGLYKMRG